MSCIDGCSREQSKIHFHYKEQDPTALMGIQVLHPTKRKLPLMLWACSKMELGPKSPKTLIAYTCGEIIMNTLFTASVTSTTFFSPFSFYKGCITSYILEQMFFTREESLTKSVLWIGKSYFSKHTDHYVCRASLQHVWPEILYPVSENFPNTAVELTSWLIEVILRI